MRPLAVLGNVNVDLILGPVPPWPRPGTEVIVEHDDLRIGGAAGNTALAWQGLGRQHRIFANLGTDMFGTWLADGFGSQAECWPREDSATTVSVGITHPGGERTFVTSRGHLPLFSWDGLEAMLDGADLKGGILLVCGCFLTEKLTGDYHRLFEWAAAEDVEIALDTGWPLDGWTPRVREEALGWLPHCRYLLLNEIETTHLADAPTVEAAAEALLPRLRPDGVVVSKLGPRGAAARAADGRVIDVAAPGVAVIDTIGAGDVFNAGFLASIAAGGDLRDALTFGISLASRAVSSSPRRYDLEDQS
ncbi:carbohydrate kinase family protein [Aurantimonas sp. VKM B-3413]|uniref:carbohydrate kinase family protein n=1 Tax=Aurantimonas sp. VKM B-3413 TaxID=2779401 RepID=UPI001E449349|nr:carbohydrate kinase family protein [Aurantimonas sp. VKM B-3413]MCB8840411.1 carbohydrate kinase family protein [Aurantimonas sp. VKM B-3413]